MNKKNIYISIALVIIIVIIGICLLPRIKSDKIKKSDNKDNYNIRLGEEYETDSYTIKLDKYESFNYKSSNKYSTMNMARDGYQQVAFHFVIKGTKNEGVLSPGYYQFRLFADEVEMERTALSPSSNADIGDKKSFDVLNPKFIKNGEEVEGYVGFYVLKSSEILDIEINNNIKFKILNPYYERK